MTVISIGILYDTASGKLSINGPIQDRVACYGVLGLARDAIFEHYLNNRKTVDVQIPPGTMKDLDDLIRGKKKP